MLNDPLSIDQAIEVLNSLVRCDRRAVEELITVHVPCNDELVKHPSVQVLIGIEGVKLGFVGSLKRPVWYISRWGKDGLGPDLCSV
jgi:hypothetical protein